MAKKVEKVVEEKVEKVKKVEAVNGKSLKVMGIVKKPKDLAKG